MILYLVLTKLLAALVIVRIVICYLLNHDK